MRNQIVTAMYICYSSYEMGAYYKSISRAFLFEMHLSTFEICLKCSLF